MKATGIVRKLDKLGRIVLPKELRRTMSIDTGTPIEIYSSPDSIVLTKFYEKCYICGSEDDVIEFKDKYICNDCIDGLLERNPNY